MNVFLTYRNRVITATDLGFIVKMIDQHRSKGHKTISRRLCEAWECRDAFIGWSNQARELNRHLLAYNTRSLNLP